MRVLSCFLLGCSALLTGCGESQDAQVVRQLQKLGAEVTLDDKSSGKPVVSVTLRGPEVTDAALGVLKGLKKLQVLDLGSTKVTDDGLENLKGMVNLQSLELFNTQITDAGLEHLKGLTSLAALNLSYDTKVTGSGLVHLKGLTKLRSLNLYSTNVTDAALKHLEGLASLQSVDLTDTKVTDAGVESLAAAMPNCRILWGKMSNGKPTGASGTMAEQNAKEGAEFLAANAKKEGVQTTASGLQYLVLKSGDGPMPKESDTVKTHYHGTLSDGTVFDSSVERKQPASFGVSQVIAGWTEALQLMHVGDKWRLFIPSDLAYGPSARGGKIGPNAVLVFEIELLEIVK